MTAAALQQWVPQDDDAEGIFYGEYDDEEYGGGQRSGDFGPNLGVPEIDAETGKTREYKCMEEECGKIFNDQGNKDFLLKNKIGSYRKHQMTHGERMYICKVPTCGKRFLDNSKLKRH